MMKMEVYVETIVVPSSVCKAGTLNASQGEEKSKQIYIYNETKYTTDILTLQS